MVSISINISEEMKAEVEEIVDASNVYESRSHYFRVAHRELQDQGEGPQRLP